MNRPSREQPIVHMVGSIPLKDPETVFRTVSEALGPHLKRLPDGETGKRARWIRFVGDQLRDHPDFEVDPDVPVYKCKQWDGQVVFEIEQLKFKDGVKPSTVTFDTGYANDAIRSFAIFERLQDEGVIPKGVRYQTCSATPLAITYMFIASRAREDFTRVYTEHLIGEIKRIAQMLPNDRISYQWDVCQEVLMWEGYFEQPPNYKQDIFSVLGRVGDAVREAIDLGYHLCYGSPKDEHCIQPKDTANLVEIANGIVAAVQRPIQYIHMPTPKDRSDDDYFRPLRDLRLPEGTELYLGLVHDNDEAGNAAKLAKARTYTSVAGIAAECGLGRGNPDRLTSILRAHHKLAESGGT
jgi:hypothetical protein